MTQAEAGACVEGLATSVCYPPCFSELKVNGLEVMRYTGLVKELAPNEVFVFGSNYAGRHGKGAAAQARKWGAKNGQGSGLMGRTYGIPTKGYDLSRALPLRDIRREVDVFVAFAATNPDLTFLVTEVGCGLAGYSVDQIAPLFKACMGLGNVVLPRGFVRVLSHGG